MIKTQILLYKTIEGNRRLMVRVRVRFVLYYSEIAPTDPWCNMLRTIFGGKNMRRKCQINTLLKKFSIFANLLMERSDNSFAIVKMWKKTSEEKTLSEKDLHLYLKIQSGIVFSLCSCKSTSWFLQKRNIDSKRVI